MKINVERYYGNRKTIMEHNEIFSQSSSSKIKNILIEKKLSGSRI